MTLRRDHTSNIFKINLAFRMSKIELVYKVTKDKIISYVRKKYNHVLNKSSSNLNSQINLKDIE